MERALYLTNYRNIGFGESERIVLNRSLELGKMGDLVVVIGANNSGKSNVLNAIYSFGKQAFNDNDITTLFYEEKYQTPQISLSCKDGSDEYTWRLTQGKPSTHECFSPGIKPTVIQNRQELASILTYLQSNWNYNRYYNTDPVVDQCATLLGKIEDCPLKIIQSEADAIIKNIAKAEGKKDIIQDIKAKFKDSEFVKRMDSGNAQKRLEDQYRKKYGIDFFPTVLRYEDTPIKNSQLSCLQTELSKNAFLQAVFKCIGISQNRIKNTYDAFRKQNNKGALYTLEKEINHKLTALSDHFNQLYFAENDTYGFGISLESERIFFYITRGEGDLSLDYQSTGFRWFFNLYFNLLCKNELQPGDIIVMDQPGMDLHIKGREELRKFLKGFARRNDLTIVIATHEPSMIDLDCLDEIRVVSVQNNIAYICNDFAAIDPDDPDCLKPIKEALTVENHILFDPDMDLVFVEGITDYNYLLAFKNLLKADNLAFLPIQGVGNAQKTDIAERQKNIIQALIRLKKHNPILLVDADKAGLDMKKRCESEKTDLRVCTLADIDPAFKTIESLFDTEDQNKLGLVDENGKYIKNSSLSSVIKNNIESYSLSEVTKENFLKVLTYLKD